MKNAIIYLTHHATEHDNIQLTSLTDVWNCKNCENDLYVVMDVTQATPDTNRIFHIKNLSTDKSASPQLIELTEEQVTSYLYQLNYVMKYYESTRNPLFYGNCMLMIMYVWLNLLKDLDYDYVWVIEYDVYYKGNWSNVFDFFSDKTEDFIPAQINPYSMDFWHARQHDFKENISIEEFLISFNPIMRLSRKALDTLDASYRKGSSGFYEIFPATLFNHLGDLTQKDMCKFGFADRERFTYIKRRSLDNKLINKDNFLYHPVKDVTSLTACKKDVRTAIVCIAANENLYIRDFVKWHLKLGFTKIFIGDNSPVDGEHPDFILSDFIDSGQVEIIRLYKHEKNPQFLQMIFYSIVYEQYHHMFDWMFFIDVDEFMTFNNNKFTDIREWLSQDYLENADEIRLNWMCFGDNDQLYYDNRPVWKRFPKPMSDINKNDWCGNYPVNGTLKSAIRCTASIANFVATSSPHWAATDKHSKSIVVSPSGKQRPWNRSVNFIDYEVAYLAHYRTLTITEFLHRRIGKQLGAQATGCVHSKDTYFKQFTTENEMTLEKQAIWNVYFERFEREHPGIFDQENLVAMKRPSDEELEKYIQDVRAVIKGEAEWTY